MEIGYSSLHRASKIMNPASSEAASDHIEMKTPSHHNHHNHHDAHVAAAATDATDATIIGGSSEVVGVSPSLHYSDDDEFSSRASVPLPLPLPTFESSRASSSSRREGEGVPPTVMGIVDNTHVHIATPYENINDVHVDDNELSDHGVPLSPSNTSPVHANTNDDELYVHEHQISYTSESIVAVVHELCRHGIWSKLEATAFVGMPLYRHPSSFWATFTFHLNLSMSCDTTNRCSQYPNAIIGIGIASSSSGNAQ
jgi:hypothetical protein